MCEIAGIYFGNGRFLEHGVPRAMVDAIAYRRPDAEAILRRPAAISSCNRRLPVIEWMTASTL
jgi:hypothetical protein